MGKHINTQHDSTKTCGGHAKSKKKGHAQYVHTHLKQRYAIVHAHHHQLHIPPSVFGVGKHINTQHDSTKTCGGHAKSKKKGHAQYVHTHLKQRYAIVHAHHHQLHIPPSVRVQLRSVCSPLAW